MWPTITSVDQFFWHPTNQRTSGYGGRTLAERARFAVELIRAVRKAAGPDFPVVIFGECMASENELAAARFQGRHVAPDRAKVVGLATENQRAVIASSPSSTGRQLHPCLVSRWLGLSN